MHKIKHNYLNSISINKKSATIIGMDIKRS